jgi:hypothetical protein
MNNNFQALLYLIFPIPPILMSLEIKTYPLRPSNVYYGGEEITGYLELHGPLDIPDATLKISFKGGSEAVQTIKNRDLTDKQIFFQTTQDLFQGALVLQENEIRTFPYKFSLPDETEPQGGNAKVKICTSKRKKDFYEQGPHAIPPSCAFSGGFPHAWSALVFYRLDAEISGKRFKRTKNGAIEVVLSPAQTKYVLDHADTEHDAQSKTFTHASSRLLEGGANKRRSVSTWFSDKFASSSPKAVFSFTARTATTLSAGQDVPIQITLNYDTAASNLPSIPQFTLLELKYKIKGITHSIARGTLSPDLYIDDRSTVFKRQIRFAQLALTAGEALDVGFIDTEHGGMHYIPLDIALVSGFMTYNVSRHYAVEITIVFACGGKQMKAEFGWENVNVAVNEDYHLRPATRFARADNEGNLEGAVGVAKVVGVTALAIASILGG